jgi:hypothetical protein
MKKAKPEDVNMQPVGFRITQILTNYSLCRKTSWALIGNINATKYPYATGIKIMWKYSIPQTKKAKPEDVNMQPVGFRITRILPDYIICPKTSRALIGHINTAKYPYPTGIKIMWKYSIPQTKKAKLKDVNMQPVGFRITRILTDYITCPKTSRALIGHINTAKYPYPTGIKIMWNTLPSLWIQWREWC